MGYDYALVSVEASSASTYTTDMDSHLYHTIPPAVALSFLYRPFLTALDVYKILFLISVGSKGNGID